MRKWQLITAATVGIMASGSGFIQADAAIFTFEVDFLDKEVDNFDDFTQVFSVDTYNLQGKATFFWDGLYRFNTCSPDFTANMNWTVGYRLNGTGTHVELGRTLLPDFPCTTDETFFTASTTVDLTDDIVEAIMDDDADFVDFRSRVTVGSGIPTGTQLLLRDYKVYFDITYDFNTTYLFNYFLSDQNYVSKNFGNLSFLGNATQTNYLSYVYTTAGNDSYYIFNSLITDIGTTRKKYAVNYEDVYFRGESVGAGFYSEFTGSPDVYTWGSTSAASLNWIYNYYFLNTANFQQPIVDVPEFNFEYEDCGSFLALNVGCFINNGLAYITNDAPIISDAIILLNSGMQMAGQAFGVIGSFTDDNVFGVLVLGGLGLIAVRWFLKND